MNGALNVEIENFILCDITILRTVCAYNLSAGTDCGQNEVAGSENAN